MESAIDLPAILIIGANSGIAKSLVQIYAKQHCQLILTTRSSEKNKSLQTMIDHLNPKAIIDYQELELTSANSIKKFLNYLKNTYKEISVMLLAAGIHIPKKYIKTSENYELHYQINYLANALLCLSLIEIMEIKNIIYIGSNAYLFYHHKLKFNFWYFYARSKYKAMNFIMHLHEIYHGRVQIYNYSPGYVRSDIHRYKSKFTRLIGSILGRSINCDQAAGELFSVINNPQYSNFIHRGRTKKLKMKLNFQQFNNDLFEILTYSSAINIEQEKKYLLWNFSETIYKFSEEMHTPKNVETLQEIVRKASRNKKEIKVFGAKHSYNPCFYTKKIAISLQYFNKIIQLDAKKRIVTCESGVTIQDLVTFLHERKFTLKYCSSYGAQTIAGLISTGTHGYGREGGLLSELVQSMVIIDGLGNRQEINDQEELAAFRLNLGILGIILQVTLQVIPIETICEYQIKTLTKNDFFKNMSVLFRENDHLRFYPHFYQSDYFSILMINLIDHKNINKITQHAFIENPYSLPIWLITMIRNLIYKSFFKKIISKLKISKHFAVPYSADLMLKSGLSSKLGKGLWRFFYSVINMNKGYNLEIAISVSNVIKFIDFFDAIERQFKFVSSLFYSYYTARYVGQNSSCLLAQNSEEAVIFFDIHVHSEPVVCREFILKIQKFALDELSGKLHWGKTILNGTDEILKNYSALNIAKFKIVKQKYDPQNVFGTFLETSLGSF